VRPLDLRYEEILASADETSLRWTKRGAAFAFVLAAVSLVPVAGGAVAYVLLVAGQFLWAGFLVSRPYHRHYSGMRRIVARWVRRLGMVLVVVPLHAAAFVPFLALVTSPAVFFGACWAVRAYARFHLVREKERRPITAAEKVLAVILGLAALAALCGAGLLVYIGVLTLEWMGK
jgi:hypothetical protein